MDLYKSAGDACEKEGGLAVIAVIVEVGDNKHEELEKIVKLIDNIKYKDEKVVLNECIYVDKLIPKSWYSYSFLFPLFYLECHFVFNINRLILSHYLQIKITLHTKAL